MSLIQQILSSAGEPCTVLLRDRVEDEVAEELLKVPGVTSLIVSEQPVALAFRFPRRVGWFEPYRGHLVLPDELARQLVYLGDPREFGFRAAQRSLSAGIRYFRCIDSPQRPFMPQSMLVFTVQRLVRSFLYRVGIYKRFLEISDRMRIKKLERNLPAKIAIRSNPIDGRVIAVIGSLAAGGSERQLVSTLCGLAEQGCKDIALLHERPMLPPYDFHLWRLKGTPVTVSQLVPLHFRALDDWISTKALADLLELNRVSAGLGTRIMAYALEFKVRRPEVVHTWLDEINVTAGLAAVLAGVPRVVLGCRSLAPENFAFFQPYMKPLYKMLVRSPTVVVLNNSEAGARDYERWLNLPSGKIKVIRNGFDFSTLTPNTELSARSDALRRRLGVASSAMIVGTVMRLSEEKRPLLWLETAAAVHAVEKLSRFLIVGDGPLRSELEASVRDLGMSDVVYVIGQQEDIAMCLAAMDVFLLTSRVEGMPNVLIEAQALGIPAVSTRVGGVPEILEDGVTGFVVSKPSASALAEAVVRLLHDREFQARTHEIAPARTRDRFSVERMVDETLQLYGPTFRTASKEVR